MTALYNRIKKFPEWIWHILIWAAIILLSIIWPIFSAGNEDAGYLCLINIIAPFCICILFYLNYCFLVDRLWSRKRYFLFIIINITAIAVMFLIEFVCNYELFQSVTLSPEKRDLPTTPEAMTWICTTMSFPSHILAACLSTIIRAARLWNKAQAELREMERAGIEAELQNLKSQLNPHFLFNTLNNIYVLAGIDGDKAQEAIHSLSDLLRHVLHDLHSDWVPLEQEIAFTKDYIELQALRLDENRSRLTVSFPQAEMTKGFIVAPLLLMTLIENAFKHGVSTTTDSFIDIQIAVEDNLLKAIIRNSMFPKTESDRSGSGIGLENLSRRLELLYGKDYEMSVDKTDDTYQVMLNLKLKHGTDQDNSGGR